MSLMTDKYCPRGEIKKLEFEMWNLKVKSTDVVTYSQSFQELALMCDQMFLEEIDQVEKYVGGLLDTIHSSVMATKPKTMQDAIEFITELMDKKINTWAERQAENKRKSDDTAIYNRTGAPKGKELGLMKPLSVSSCSCSASSFISNGANLYGSRATGVALVGVITIRELNAVDTKLISAPCPPWHCMGSFMSSGLNVGVPPCKSISLQGTRSKFWAWMLYTVAYAVNKLYLFKPLSLLARSWKLDIIAIWLHHVLSVQQ
ncbi:hypothetical protein Tco_1369321 [Tanacetum coccineum]